MVNSAAHPGYFVQLRWLTLFRLFILSALLLLANRVLPLPGGYFFTAHAANWYLFVGVLFFLTLLYLFWLRSRRHLGLLARVQCAIDPILVTILVILTGGMNSPLQFLYALAVLNTAMLLGRREAVVVAGMGILLFMLGVSITSMWQNVPVEPNLYLLRRLVFNGTAFLLTALLGGALAARASSLQRAVEQQKDSLANLAFLHQQMVEAMPYGLVSVNTEGVIRLVNGTASAVLGLEGREVVGLPLERELPELCWTQRTNESGTVYLEQQRNGTILGVGTTPLLDQRQRVIGSLIIIRDLSAQKRLEQELAEREKLALTGRMAAYVAHEIRNPLAAILSAAQMLVPGSAQNERLQGIIVEETGRLNQLTTDFLFFARPPQPARTALDLHQFVDQMANRLREDPRWGERSRLVNRVGEGVVVRFDLGHLRQLFWNLLINAAQAAIDAVVVEVSALVSGGEVRVVVADNGPGMPPNDLRMALEPFFTTRSTGTGLGLAVVAQLMLQNRGSINLMNGHFGGLEVHLTMETVNGENPDL